MSIQVDLQQLAVDRNRQGPTTDPPRRNVLVRYVFPAVILVAFVALIGWAARDHFLPVRAVTVTPVITTRVDVQRSGTPLFQAAGWVEPRPTPVLASALTEGVIEEVFVVEGQDVQAGEPVAKLVDADARLQLEEARAAVELRRAELETVGAERTAAHLRKQHPVQLDAALADAEATLAEAQIELKKLPFDLQAAEARLVFARQNRDSKTAAGSAVAERLVQQAESELAAAEAEVEDLKRRAPQLRQRIAALQRKQSALDRQRELLIEETRAVADAEARLKVASARLEQARIAVRRAELRLERMTVRAPIDGRVLALLADPGSMVMGQSPQANPRGSAVVSLYDPQKLQVRADVRLEDVPLVQPRQRVVIETASASEPMEGTVLFNTSQANIQKNTLEVKVAIDAPPPTLRPEMLVQATFLAVESQDVDSNAGQRRERLLVPKRLVDASEQGAAVWIADADGTARRRTITLGKATRDHLVEVVDGLAPTDKIISQGWDDLRDGDRIVISGEDSQ